MKRHILLIAVALVLSSVAAEGQTAFLVSGGATAPVAHLGDIADIGYNAAIAIDLGATALPVGARLEVAYNDLGYKGGGGDVRIISGTANAIFNLGLTRDAPYVIAGVGAYNRNSGSSALGYGSGQTVAGVNGGAGLRFPLSGLSTFVEVRYHVMLGRDTDGTNYQFIPITFGIAF